ncbi:MAG: chemotaxis protein CheX [Bacillota bacterium]|nr:chemotaxis protein CheX [Bacillota bacterium]
MTLTKSVNDVLYGMMDSVKSILPFDIITDQPSTFIEPISHHSFGVLIGMTGNINGNIIIDGNEDIFQKIGECMFGMKLEGEMLQSFAGELGNMLAGTLSTSISTHGLEMDITPPTVLVKETFSNIYERAFKLPFHLADIGSLFIILMMDY